MEPPTKTEPSDQAHYGLYKEVRAALYALPAHFQSETVITGIPVPDLQALNTAISTAIEDQVVNTLNAMRKVWDEEDNYLAYGFYRQPQTFPDVVLKKHAPDGKDDIILGIELKGWYMLSKEGEPSLRFKQTASVCSPFDLICIVPWALSNVISGQPKAYTPWVESAHFAAEYRNYYWQNVKNTKLSTDISVAETAKPYPVKSDKILDKPAADESNFGRLARYGLMDGFLQNTLNLHLAGIRARHWLSFFKMFKENAEDDDIQRQLETLQKKLEKFEKETGAK